MADIVNVKVKLLSEEAKVPARQTEGSSGLDLHALEDGCIHGLTRGVISTGIALEIPEGYEGQIRPRSGLSLMGITVANSPGTIDSDYRGEIMVLIANNSCENFQYSKGDRIAQIVFHQLPKVKIEITDGLKPSKRGKRGLGSTGKNANNDINVSPEAEVN